MPVIVQETGTVIFISSTMESSAETVLELSMIPERSVKLIKTTKIYNEKLVLLYDFSIS